MEAKGENGLIYPKWKGKILIPICDQGKEGLGNGINILPTK